MRDIIRGPSLLGWLVLAFLLIASKASADDEGSDAADPRQGAVALEAEGGWQAQLCLDRGKTGVWTVKAFPLFGAVGTEEIVALDDAGRVQVLIPYSGRWSGPQVLSEGSWLGGLCHGDLDPTIAGAELYTGGERGNLWQITAHPDGVLEPRRVVHLPGREIHTLVVGEIDPAHAGPELLMFTWPGGLYRVRSEQGKLVTHKLMDLSARVRDAVLLPARAGAPRRIATVSRGGELSIYRVRGEQVDVETIHRVQSGLGRIALRASQADAPAVLYVVADDGCVYRVVQTQEAWASEMIYAGPLGMRGVVSGRFDADPGVETIAVFGYGKEVELLSRRDGRWSAQTIFRARDKGHWICKAEVDNRNGTDELLCCGYGGRVVMMHRPPGYGRADVLARTPAAALPRLGLAGLPARREGLSPRQYGGGFRVKNLVFETLVAQGEDGRVVPGLAVRHRVEAEGRRWHFHLREDARFHDGRVCDAEAVVASFRAWLGQDAHAWLGVGDRVERVEAVGSREVVFHLTEPYDLLTALTSVNPCAIAHPDAPTVGTGAWKIARWDGPTGGELQRVADGARLEIVRLPARDHVARLHLNALKSGMVDAVVDGWVPHLPRAESLALAEADAELSLVHAPGTRTVFLACNTEQPALATEAARQAVARAISNEALVEATQAGLASPALGLFGYGAARAVGPAAAPGAEGRSTLRLIVYQHAPDLVRVALAIARQLQARGPAEVSVESLDRESYVARLRAGSYELRLGGTHGRPYDPWLWLAARGGGPDWLAEAVVEARGAANAEEALIALEARLAEDARWIPLYVPDRIALVRKAVLGIRLGATAYQVVPDPQPQPRR